PLVDGLGPLLDRNDIQCVVVTTETYNSIKGVNSTRRRLGLKKLSVVILGLILAEDGKPIRTTRIVKGEIDRTGRVVGSRG
ncbi:MAG: phosphopantetheine adenylyltransferase, partial [Thermoprotei archaeon]